ncbi:hypothetical protein WN943_017649 [Citrus x changshan-huyou]
MFSQITQFNLKLQLSHSVFPSLIIESCSIRNWGLCCLIRSQGLCNHTANVPGFHDLGDRTKGVFVFLL